VFGDRRALIRADRKEVNMKSLVSRILVAGFALAGLVAVEAQSRMITANVPFSFYMGSSAMPQGVYQVNELALGKVVALRNQMGGKSIAVWQTTGKARDEAPRLVFHRYGETYFLSEIWDGNGDIGLQLARSAREKELASNGAAPVLAVVRLAIH
jgi:hypothetical protein